MRLDGMQAERLRARLRGGKPVIAGHVFLTDPEIAELLGYHGFDAVWIDAEHSAFDLNAVLAHIMACASSGTASLVRVAWNDPVRIKPVLEMGPDGIILPMVCTAEEARQAVRNCTYPPRGVRGFGPRRANRYGALESGEYAARCEGSLLRILQIEHRVAMENLEEILQVEGVDLLVCGPCDLSASYGHLCDTRNPEMTPVYDRFAQLCRAAGMPFGVSLGAGDRASIRDWFGRGANFVGCGDDISYLDLGCRATFDFLRENGWA